MASGRKAFKTLMKSYNVQIPKFNHLRIRPWFILATVLIMLLLAFLGFTNFSRSLPLNDKALHFLCFGIATGVFYFIFDVDEEARRHWAWRNLSLIITLFVCFFCGGILSEFVQSMLPVRHSRLFRRYGLHSYIQSERLFLRAQFQFGDIVANLLGSSIGLMVSYHLERYYRTRREIARLYQPLDAGSSSDLEDEDEDLQLLPTHRNSQTPATKGHKSTRLADVWDEREELFGIGGDSDDEERDVRAPLPVPSNPPAANGPPVPKVYVTSA
ncbi:hypothetical protein HMN09_00082900 [Mycena chlorophos]|uniref:VanZ-like domain-containing protein n=1 Tax=Mycena chlorophos TaxID=658473 RepID=A0A8H6TTH1_MYCCL|nr:hypothetical protein HMN09_00082900 [Mycena chlorophos]